MVRFDFFSSHTLRRKACISSQEVVVVDFNDRPLGTLSTADAHRGSGVLHRAVSVFLFSSSGDVLLQQRSNQKPLWPGYWSNSCCTHPLSGESYQHAAHRRVQEELGKTVPLQFLFRFQYQASYCKSFSEYELCSVFSGEVDEVVANAAEIQSTAWLSPHDLSAAIAETPHIFTPWLKLEWKMLLARQQNGVAAR